MAGGFFPNLLQKAEIGARTFWILLWIFLLMKQGWYGVCILVEMTRAAPVFDWAALFVDYLGPELKFFGEVGFGGGEVEPSEKVELPFFLSENERVEFSGLSGSEEFGPLALPLILCIADEVDVVVVFLIFNNEFSDAVGEKSWKAIIHGFSDVSSDCN